MAAPKFDFGKKGDSAASAHAALLQNPELAQLAANPKFTSAIEGQLNNLIGQSSGYFEELPKRVQQRIKLLRLLQDENMDLEKQFQEELSALKKKYDALHAPLMARRARIVSPDGLLLGEEADKAVTEAVQALKKKTAGDDEGKGGKSEEPSHAAAASAASAAAAAAVAKLSAKKAGDDVDPTPEETKRMEVLWAEEKERKEREAAETEKLLNGSDSEDEPPELVPELPEPSEDEIASMGVGALKAYLKERSVDSSDCVEKSDLVKRAQDTRAKNVASKAGASAVAESGKSLVDGVDGGEAAAAAAGGDEGKKEEKDEEDDGKDITGVPDFWRVVFENHEIISEMTSERDAEVLAFLRDIRVQTGVVEGHPLSFSVIFEFAPNPFFSNTVLVKTYDIAEEGMTSEANFQGFEGCKINWKGVENNVTVEVTKVRQPGGGPGGRRGGPRGGRRGGARAGAAGGGAARFVQQIDPCQSFFRFFDPLNELGNAGADGDLDLDEEELQNAVFQDYQLGEEFREKIVPYAVLWYLGDLEAEIDEDALDFDDSDDSDDDGFPAGGFKASAGTRALAGGDLSSDDSSSDEDYAPDPKAPGGGETPGECKQQ